MDKRIPDAVFSDIERAVIPAVRLIKQITTYTRPEQYDFTGQFPEYFRSLSEVAAQFKRSDIREVKLLGRSLAQMLAELMALDEIGNKSLSNRNYLRQLDRLEHAIRAVIKAQERFGRLIVREEAANHGV